jgi:uncharacterized protein (TIGR03437 family)
MAGAAPAHRPAEAWIAARAATAAALLGLCCAAALYGQTLRRPLVIRESRYRVVAGERIPLEASPETVAFMRSAKTRIARASNRTFPVAPDVAGDRVLLGIPLTAEPGDYTISLSVVSDAGEERSTTLQVTVAPFASPAAGSTAPPVVLLDGWQAPGATGCPMATDSSGTFGNLASYLPGAPVFAPTVYFFENCTQCPDCTIEQLGADLGTFLNAIRSSDGTPVPQVDVIAHSMGGLIVRSYLSGKQPAAAAFTPPATPKIRKAVFIGTPHFGAFQADSPLADLIFGQGNQTGEMKRGSRFLWDLATWNQFGDDLRGTDALAVIGSAGTDQSRASDGVVGLTSGSLDFVRPGRTRIVNYCHIPLTLGVAAAVLGCIGPGIAYIDAPSHPTYQIVSSFLVDSVAWQSVGTAPPQDQYLSKYSGIIVADVSSINQYVTPSSVSWGGVALAAGAAEYLYYNDMVNGTGSFAFGSSTCGPYTAPIGAYSAVRCKSSPAVNSVGPLLTVPARVVQAGNTITIAGAGFGAEECPACRVTASSPQSAPQSAPQPTPLQISSWSDTIIRAFLPASFAGMTQLGVTTASGSDAISIMAAVAQASPPTVNIAAVANAAGLQAGIASATWVSIFGANLSQTTRGWQAGDFVSGRLPVALDGVAVTVNGLPAYIGYVSPTQVNILAPDDATVGAVQVQVTTAQGKSNIFTAQKQPFAPAFFWMAGGPYAAAQHADYTYVGKPGLIAGVTTQPARPGETILLYGTGFGPANPPFSSAQLVTTPAALANSVQVTIGGLPAPVAYAGRLYQFNVTVPNVPNGDAAVMAQIGGVQTQTGVSITIQR